jgi:hypothetical protein
MWCRKVVAAVKRRRKRQSPKRVDRRLEEHKLRQETAHGLRTSALWDSMRKRSPR